MADAKLETLFDKMMRSIDACDSNALKAVFATLGLNADDIYALVNHKVEGEYTSTPLFCAADNNDIACCELLLQHGARIDSGKSDHGDNSLHAAIDNTNIVLLRLLIENSLDELATSIALCEEDRNGATPMRHALRNGDLEIINYLKEQIGEEKDGDDM